MNSGKLLRLRRLFKHDNKKTLVVPMDHGITLGAIKGIANAMDTIKLVSDNGADGVVVHRGLGAKCGGYLNSDTALIVHLSASTNIGNSVEHKVQVCTVEEALRMGADAVSIHINFGSNSESDQLCKLARVSAECDRLGVPLIAMTYARGTDIDEFDPINIAHAARVAYELGADVVKCHYTGDPITFEKVVQSCPVPLLIAGGERRNQAYSLFQTIYDSIQVGGAGISIGRNIFEHDRPDLITRQICKILNEGVSPVDAEKELIELMMQSSENMTTVI